jgi:hypothetical protein
MHTILSSVLLAIALCQAHFVAVASASLEESCLALGFDSENLSCETCNLLKESTTLHSLQQEHNDNNPDGVINLVKECESCCQPHKFNPALHSGQSLRGKYRYALLTYDDGSLDQHGEIKDFIDRDVNDILSFKGENRFRVSASKRGSGLDASILRQMMVMGQFHGLGGSAPKLLLFESVKKGGWTEDDEDEAGEVITLRGWKREDLKDMLLTLLPNA